MVGTGNVCRSPYLERRLRATNITVGSAGTDALVGNPMEPLAAARLSRAGGDAEGFEARQLTAGMVRDADLVLCATRAHRTAVVRLEPKGLRRVFDILGFVDLARHIPSGPAGHGILDAPGDRFVQRVVAAAARQRDRVHARPAGAADVPDPFGRGVRDFDKMAEQMEAVLVPIVPVLRTVITPRFGD